MDKEDAVKAGLFEVIGQAVDDAYMAELKKQIIHMDAIQAEGRNLKIVYTPLHGTGNITARRILKELGKTAGTSGRKFPDRSISKPGISKGI